MTKPLVFFIDSVAVSLVMAVPFAGYHRYEERHYAELVATCKAENEHRAPKNQGYVWFDSCEFNEVLRIPFDVRSPTERSIVNEHPSLKKHTLEVYLWSAAAVLLVGAVPGVWYFLLRRLSEVSRALRGL